jgi:hypothetical protein
MITILNHDEYNYKVRTDSINGDYYMMLAPGTYTFEFFAANHFTKTISGVQVNNYQATILNVELVPDDIIPVNFSIYNAGVINNTVKLNWETISETNNRGFEIQRKRNNENYIILGFVEGNGTTTSWSQYSFIDENVEPGLYLYRLKQVDFDGSFTYWASLEVYISAPLVFSLEQNYPNPFNPTTKIKYRIPLSPPLLKGESEAGGFITLKVYDVLGNEVAILVNEESASYEVEFNGTGLPSGIYFYQLKTSDLVNTRKMVLMK